VKTEAKFETNSTIDKPEMNHTSTEGRVNIVHNIIEIAWLYPTFCDLLFPKFMAYSDSMALVTKFTQLLYYASVSV
jgi:hypothetical protein